MRESFHCPYPHPLASLPFSDSSTIADRQPPLDEVRIASRVQYRCAEAAIGSVQGSLATRMHAVGGRNEVEVNDAVLHPILGAMGFFTRALAIPQNVSRPFNFA